MLNNKSVLVTGGTGSFGTRFAEVVLKKYKLRRLAVVKDKKIVGEITLNQLIRKFYGATQYRPMVEDEEG